MLRWIAAAQCKFSAVTYSSTLAGTLLAAFSVKLDAGKSNACERPDGGCWSTGEDQHRLLIRWSTVRFRHAPIKTLGLRSDPSIGLLLAF